MLENRTPTWKKLFFAILALILVTVLVLIVIAGVYIYQNLNYYKWDMENVTAAGFVEKQTEIDGYVTNYAEGPDNGEALLLIHGQGSQWEDYADVLPALSEVYHIYAIDVYGHGQSARLPAEDYTNVRVGTLIAGFMQEVIGEPAVVSGHSSGALITTWIAANYPELVSGVVLEDPPFFSSIMPRAEHTSGGELALITHDFTSQNESSDFQRYYIENGTYFFLFGDAESNLIGYSLDYMDQHPGEPLELFFMPPNVNMFFRGLVNYDPVFGAAWYDNSWYEGFDTEASLSAIESPVILMHTNYWFNHHGSYYSDEGVLMAAMDNEDLDRVVSLLENVQVFYFDSGHLIHLEKANEYTEILIDLSQ